MLKNMSFDKHGVVSTYEGATTLAHMADAIAKIGAHSRLENLRYILHDCSKVDSFSFDDAQVIDAAAYGLGVLYTNNKIKAAFVTCNEGVAEAVKRYCSMTDRHVERFNSMEEAKQWASNLSLTNLDIALEKRTP
jgi:hypothetical protein